MSFLGDILARKRDEVAAARAAAPERELAARARDATPPRAFEAALSRRGGPVRVVAEVKRASPSAGARCVWKGLATKTTSIEKKRSTSVPRSFDVTMPTNCVVMNSIDARSPGDPPQSSLLVLQT